MTNTTDHVAEALKVIDKYSTGTPSAQVAAATIEGHATLELAKQLRIRNLLDFTRDTTFAELPRSRAAIEAGVLLGLGDGA